MLFSSPFATSQAPAEPIFQFDSFFNSSESIVQEDLVAWVCVGSMHMPTSEDAPVTSTTATATTFFIRPHNYFSESPVMDLTHRFLKTGPIAPVASPAADVSTVSVPVEARCFDDTPVPEGYESLPSIPQVLQPPSEPPGPP